MSCLYQARCLQERGLLRRGLGSAGALCLSFCDAVLLVRAGNTREEHRGKKQDRNNSFHHTFPFEVIILCILYSVCRKLSFQGFLCVKIKHSHLIECGRTTFYTIFFTTSKNIVQKNESFSPFPRHSLLLVHISPE